MRLLAGALFVLALAAPLLAPATAVAAEPSAREATDPAGDLAAARALFEANLGAIRDRDRDAYLACYLDAETLARTGPGGFALGYEGLVASAGEGWPEVFEAQDLRLAPVEPGVVYGTYRYRVRFDGEEQAGLSERLFVKTDAGWKIAVTTAFPAPPGTPPPPRALVGATLVDGTGAAPVADAVVVMRDGRVECAGSRDACPVPEGVAELELAGHWILPGLVDAHVHFSQTGWADGRPDFVDVRDERPYPDTIADLAAHPERFFRSYLCSGVTAVFDVGGYAWTLGLGAAAEGGGEAPHVAAAGPLLSTWDFWLNLPAEAQFIYLADEEAARDGAGYLATRGADAVKIWFIVTGERPFEELEAVVGAAAAEASRRGLPLVVHATGLTEAKAAVRAGAHLLVHSVMDREVDDEFIALLVERGTIYTPTLTVLRGYLAMAEAIAAGAAPAIDDPNGCVDPATRERVAATAGLDPERFGPEVLAERRRGVAARFETAAGNLARLAGAGVPIAMGTDAGNPLTLHGPSVYAEMEAMQAAGLAPMEVLVAATRNGARAMGRETDVGTVEAGKIADLVVVAADPLADVGNLRRVRYVVRGGVLRPIEELSAVAGRP